MKELVTLARNTVEEYFKTGELAIITSKKYKRKRGTFVTINTYPENELRGCVGFPIPHYPLYEAVQKASIEAAFHDIRFSPLKKEELNKIVFEVSVLTLPEEIPGKNLEKIEIGKDGIILEYSMRNALFLPQVWEDIPNKKEFLEALYYKCGIPLDKFLDENSKLYKFQVKAFKETKPKGKVIEVKF
jgi:AmmeMemoRadiSam system protein A